MEELTAGIRTFFSPGRGGFGFGGGSAAQQSQGHPTGSTKTPRIGYLSRLRIRCHVNISCCFLLHHLCNASYDAFGTAKLKVVRTVPGLHSQPLVAAQLYHHRMRMDKLRRRGPASVLRAGRSDPRTACSSKSSTVSFGT